MDLFKLSIIIPSNSEMFLTRTIQDILENSGEETEVIAVLDGKWADPPIPQHNRVNVVFVPQAIGQRAATNIGCKLARGKYVMKVDAHCAFDKDFDKKMLEAFEKTGDNVTMVPIMRNLWVFDWKCFHCGWKQYQDAKPEKCGQCGKSDKLRHKMIWIGKPRPQSTSYCFDSTPHFQYFSAYTKREEYKKMLQETGMTETMSLQGSCFMCTKEKYNDLNLCDESLGNWGNQGIEVACKTWLSGGRVLVNHNTWYAHMFRTHTGFSFPWGNKENEVKKTKDNVWKQITEMKCNKQIYPVDWLVKKFSPVLGWK